MASLDEIDDDGFRNVAEINLKESGFAFPFPKSAENIRFLGGLISSAFDPDIVPMHRESYQTGIDITKAYYRQRYSASEIILKRVEFHARYDVGSDDVRLIALRVLVREILGGEHAIHRSHHPPPCPIAINVHSLWNGKKVNELFPPEQKRITDILTKAGVVAGKNNISRITFDGVPVDGIPIWDRYDVACYNCKKLTC